MNYSYLALMAGILLVMFLLVRWVIQARRRFGWPGAWLVIVLEACAAGGVMYLAAKHVPGMGETWLGQQLILAIVGIGLTIVIGGGLVMALGRR